MGDGVLIYGQRTKIKAAGDYPQRPFDNLKAAGCEVWLSTEPRRHGVPREFGSGNFEP